MIKLNNKGLSVIELIVSFVLCLLVFVFIIQVVTAIQELYINLGIKTSLLNRQAIISAKINDIFSENKTRLIKSCGNDCLTIFYKDNTFEKMQISKSQNTFIIGDDVYNFNGLGMVESLIVTTNDSSIYNHGLLTISLNIRNEIFDNGKYTIKALYQYDNDETIYSSSTSEKPEIFLLGPAISYKFSNDLFIEPGWMVYYPSGKITINEDDVKPSAITFDDDGNGHIRYSGVGEARGASATRSIRNYISMKDYIINLYEKRRDSVYLFSDIGKYVYKGPNPNNYLMISSKLFRIISLDVQQSYVLDDSGNVVTINGEKQKENKYLLKVASNDFVEDADKNSLIPYSINATAGPLRNISPWYRKVCDGETCEVHKQNMNTIVNEVYLPNLLNTGSGALQIKNGTFNTGLVEYRTFRFSGYGGINVGEYTYDAKAIYDAEGEDVTWGDGTIDVGKWNGNCLEDVCGPNAGILSLTDILFASSDNDCLDTVKIQNGVKCVNDNWLWKQVGVGTRQDYRLMTRATLNNTWLLTEINYLAVQNVTSSYRTKATLFLDADLYVIGSGTLENPYVLYTVNK